MVKKQTSKKTKVSKKFIPQASIVSDELYIPNQSGDHSAGSVQKTPTQDLDIVNKKYVDTLTTDHPHQDVNTTASPEFAGGTYTGILYTDAIGIGLDVLHSVDIGNHLTVGDNLDVGGNLTTTGDIILDDGSATSPAISFRNEDYVAGREGKISLDFLEGLNFESYANFVFRTTQTGGGTDVVPFFNNALGDRKRSMQFRIFGAGTNSGAFVELNHTGDSGQANIKTNKGKIVFDTGDVTGGIEFIPVNRGAVTLNIHGSEQVGVGNVTPTNLFSVKEKSSMSPIGGFCIMLTNKSGANSVAGRTVKADIATDDAVVLTAANDDECFGVFLDSGVSDGSEAWVVVSGIADVAMEDNTAATRGNWVSTSNGEAGYGNASLVTPAAAPTHFEEIGHCIESVAAGGEGTHILARCVLHFN